MPDHLRSLVETIIGSFPVEDPHAQQRQQGQVVNLCLIDHMEPFSPTDHVGPQPIIKEQVRVIVMTFWYIFGTDLTFSNFLNFIFTWD